LNFSNIDQMSSLLIPPGITLRSDGIMNMLEALIVGGGISGLTVAHASGLQKRSEGCELWESTDRLGGTNGPWANTNLLAGAANGAVSATVSNLLYGLRYYYRCSASNQFGMTWAPATASARSALRA
jgi:cation diffusion facilitator CzcD-associated flavoprotein CzcO